MPRRTIAAMSPRSRRPSATSPRLSVALLRYAHEHAPGGLLTVTVHPECIGRGHRMAMLEEFIATARRLDGVVFGRLDAYVEAWLGPSDRVASDSAASDAAG